MDKKEALKKIKAGELSLEDVDKKLQACKSYKRYSIHMSDNVNDGIVTFQCIQ